MEHYKGRFVSTVRILWTLKNTVQKKSAMRTLFLVMDTFLCLKFGKNGVNSNNLE